MIRRALLLILFLVGFNFFEHFAHKKTDGFSMQRIRFPHDSTKSYSTQIDPQILKQPFHYLDCGNQCFAFVSEDGQYVLKFFKYANPPVPHFLTQIPLINKLKALRPHRYEKALWKQRRDFEGYQLAYDHFREETALLAVHFHLSQTPLCAELTDKLHITHKLDLKTTPFILQKKASPIYKQLQLWGPEEKKEGIISLVQLLKKRIALNLKDDDVHFYSNFGFVGKAAVQIDPGHFTSGSYQNPELELKTLLQPLIRWCQKNDPTLIPVIEHEAFFH